MWSNSHIKTFIGKTLFKISVISFFIPFCLFFMGDKTRRNDKNY